MRLSISLLAAALLALASVGIRPGIAAAHEGDHPGRPHAIETEHIVVESGVFYDFSLCGEGSWEITENARGVFHITEFDDGTARVTGTFLGKVTIRPIDTDLVEGEDGGLVPVDPEYDYLPGAPTYSGRYTQWFGDNSFEDGNVGTFTFSVTLRGTDGSRIVVAAVAHFTLLPDGPVVEFDKFRVRCT